MCITKEHRQKKVGKMTRKNTTAKEKEIGMELAYMVVFTETLAILSQNRRRKSDCPLDSVSRDLLYIKNILEDLFNTGGRGSGAEFQRRLYKKLLMEKLILNVVSGNKSDIRQNLRQIMETEGLSYTERDETTISSEEKFLIKVDFHGLSHYPAYECLSAYFRGVIKARRVAENRESLSRDCYNPDAIPAWKYMKQFSSFRKQWNNLAAALTEVGIPAKDIKKLNAFDMVALLKNYSIRHNLHDFEAEKVRFIKSFIGSHESEFRDYMHRNKQMIMLAMSFKGCEIDEKKDCKAYGRFVNDVVAQMKKKGIVPPLFSIHHIHPVKDGVRGQNLSKVNGSKNLCLTLDIYHILFHLFDTNAQGERIRNRKVKRLDFPEEFVFFGGFLPQNRMLRSRQPEYADILTGCISGRKGRK